MKVSDVSFNVNRISSREKRSPEFISNDPTAGHRVFAEPCPKNRTSPLEDDVTRVLVFIIFLNPMAADSKELYFS